MVLGNGVTFLKETETGGISRSENRFSLVTGSYQIIPSPNGEQSQYCIFSNGRLFFGALNESSNGETVILDGMHEMKPDEFLPGGNGSWDQMMLEALTGQDAVLSTELPESGKLIFRGWTPDKQHPETVYRPGDTLQYDSEKNVVVLYAMWDLSPSERPVLITFRANGGQPGSVPDPVSVPGMVWFRLPEAEPSWDPQHNFLGWSRNPEAERAELKPGGAATFGEDTTLYAVWRAHYTVTSGAGSSWTKHSTVGQRFVCDGNIMYFAEFRIDGKRAASGMEITSGSTVADIRPWVMEKLAPGMHTVTFVYEDGEASAKFTVKEIPKTGDPARPALWLALALIGIAGLALSCIRARTAKGKK